MFGNIFYFYRSHHMSPQFFETIKIWIFKQIKNYKFLKIPQGKIQKNCSEYLKTSLIFFDLRKPLELLRKMQETLTKFLKTIKLWIFKQKNIKKFKKILQEKIQKNLSKCSELSLIFLSMSQNRWKWWENSGNVSTIFQDDENLNF